MDRFRRFWTERAINKRLADFDKAEKSHIYAQRIVKIEEIIAEQNIRLILSDTLMCSKTGELLQNHLEVLRRRYGSLLRSSRLWRIFLIRLNLYRKSLVKKRLKPITCTKCEIQWSQRFYYASYVVGGPLLNTFFLTEAPMISTVGDFWHMVWQEESEYIFMLCEAVEAESLTVFNISSKNHCPYYWPRYEGEIYQFGKINISNVELDTAMDPLFSITHLEIWLSDNPTQKRRVQHWQWDWQDYSDFYWPLRLLIRSRHSQRPTIVQCLDGCGRSGTLVLIEILLMQLLRGAVSYENPMLTSGIFLRLQRRHAVANFVQYLFVYRVVLNWIEPFVVSRYHRLVLGFGSGVIGGFNGNTLSWFRPRV